MITPLAAAKAYAATQKVAGVGDLSGMPSLSGPSAPTQGGFGDILKSAMTDAVAASKNAERQMAAQVAGKTELVDVVTRPYDERPGLDAYARPAPPGSGRHVTFCGT